MAETLVVNELYLSLQGESTHAGLPCVFIRLTGCDLRCSYCDTAYAFTAGEKRDIGGMLKEIEELSRPYVQREGRGQLPLVELTGGEPLLQASSLVLMERLCDAGYLVLLETSGAHDIGKVDGRVCRIMDWKSPSSGEVSRNRVDNVDQLKETDEVKFVIGTEEDYEWAKSEIAMHRFADRCPVLMSWVAPLNSAQRDKSLKVVPEGMTPISRLRLVERIVEDALPVRFQLQMHKVIWDPDKKGV